LTKALTLVVPSNRPILGAGKVKLNIRPEGLKLGTEIVTLGDINLADHMMTRVSGVTIVQQPLDGGRCAINNNNLATTTGGCWDVDSGLEWYTLANRKSPEPINPFLTIYATGADIRREGVPGDAIVSFSAPADRALTPIGRVLENRDIEKTRDTAIDACLDLTANGHSDWRLPTSDEFRSLYRDHPEARFALGVQLTEQSYQIPYSGMAWTADGYGVQSLRARSTLYDLITGLPILLETPACKVTKAFRATENQGGNGFDILITDCKAESYPFGEQGNKLYSEALGRGLARGAGASFPAVICVRDRK
jgi:hypothetical protein